MRQILTSVILFFSVVSFFGQERFYEPLVREGVEWGYVCAYQFSYCEEPHTDLHYYRLQFKGDTIVDGLAYKKLYNYQTPTLNVISTPCDVLMREENKMIETRMKREYLTEEWYIESYPICNNGRYLYKYDEENDCWMIDYDYIFEFMWDGTVETNGVERQRYKINLTWGDSVYFIEGIGVVTEIEYNGSFCNLPFPVVDGTANGSWPYHQLLYVRNMDGEIIYKGPMYEKYEAGDITLHPSGIKDFKTDACKDSRIYTIDGRAVEAKSLEQLPKGIYIQNGKKIIN